MTTATLRPGWENFANRWAVAYAETTPPCTPPYDNNPGLVWQRTVEKMPAYDAVAENQLVKARLALSKVRDYSIPPYTYCGTETPVKVANALHNKNGFKESEHFLRSYIADLAVERGRRRHALGLPQAPLTGVEKKAKARRSGRRLWADRCEDSDDSSES